MEVDSISINNLQVVDYVAGSEVVSVTVVAVTSAAERAAPGIR